MNMKTVAYSILCGTHQIYLPFHCCFELDFVNTICGTFAVVLATSTGRLLFAPKRHLGRKKMCEAGEPQDNLLVTVLQCFSPLWNADGVYYAAGGPETVGHI